MLFRGVLKPWAALANREGDDIRKTEGGAQAWRSGLSHAGEGLDCQAAESGLDSVGPREPLKVIWVQ